MITFDYPSNIQESNGNDPGGSVQLQEGLQDVLDGAGAAVGLNMDSVKDEMKKANGPDKVVTGANTVRQAANNMQDGLDSINRTNRVDGRSIVARARNSVKQCPIYVTQTIRVAEAHLLAKLFEKVYTSFFQAAIAQNPIITPEEANNLNFLRQYHTDIRECGKRMINDFYQPIDSFDEMMQESIYSEHVLSDRCTVQFSVIPAIHCERILTENARLMNEPLTGINYLYQEVSGITHPLYQTTQVTNQDRTDGEDKVGKYISNQSETQPLSNMDIENMAKTMISKSDRDVVDMSDSDIEKQVNNRYPGPKTPVDKNDKDAVDRYNDEVSQNEANKDAYRDQLKNRAEEAREGLQETIYDLKKDIRSGKYNNAQNNYLQYDAKTDTYYRLKVTTSNNGERTTTRSNTVTKTNTQTHQMEVNKVPELLRQSDIKKINGMDPYMMKANFIIRDPETHSNTEVQYIIGIKSVMHLVYVQDLADELYELVTGNVKSLQKVRYKTGEIGFADYMFNIKGLKADAAKNINYNKRWISTLKQLANYNRTRGSLLKKPLELLANGETPIPNATIILSQSDVTWLVNKTGIDLSQVSNAKRLSRNLFLIAIAIVDPTAGSMKVLFDGDTDWDVQSLASIEQEVAKTDNSNLLKELQKAVNNR